MFEKLNMVIGAFFTEVGKELLAIFSGFNYKIEEMRECLIVKENWSEKDFADVSKKIKACDYSLEVQNKDLLLEVYGNDKEHIVNDITRAYRFLVLEWLVYMKHLKQEYPYLFSLEMRTNPVDKNASVEIK